MNFEKINLSLLSFGETGMELITSQEVDGIDEDHVGMIGNFYSNVLGAAEQSTGLFGPLPIAYRYDMLLFLYAFNAFDPNLKDERVIKNKNITRSSLLLFFPTIFDSILSNQRKNLNTIIDQWSKPFLTSDIRKTSIEALNQLKEKIITHLLSVTNNIDFKNKDLVNLVKIIGKHFFLMETVAFLYQKPIYIKFLTNTDKLDPILKRSILYENIDTLVDYTKKSDYLSFNLRNTKIEVISFNPIWKNVTQKIRGNYDGIFLFYDLNESAANTDSFTTIVKNILSYSPKHSKITYCIKNNLKTKFKFDESEISTLLHDQRDRSISLVDLNSKSFTLETAVIDFAEKIISNY